MDRNDRMTNGHHQKSNEASLVPIDKQLKSLLHSGYHHPTLRAWQSNEGRIITKNSLIFPIFVTDVPNQKEEIPSLPGQYRLVSVASSFSVTQQGILIQHSNIDMEWEC